MREEWDGTLLCTTGVYLGLISSKLAFTARCFGRDTEDTGRKTAGARNKGSSAVCAGRRSITNKGRSRTEHTEKLYIEFIGDALYCI